ncbi:uncharacterized protein cubi_03292 [Cryptosporidium ubiquitum]|uniref:Uncharacterized protein n=1 Tax=Cryptosporidium ubiquitum TaxID=857276 RepID=A0A1J4M9M4_9CRYT|nr:uncharacterized protein cubi_03292 [Cryptosporidium ubiquitum]OII70914.1 hypothetical protein cubi_03292 [Cryptosporidium ubiquitum]
MFNWLYIFLLLLIGLVNNHEKTDVLFKNKVNPDIHPLSYLQLPGFKSHPKLTINSEITHWVLSHLQLNQLETLISELEKEIKKLTQEFEEYKKNSRSIRANYDSHSCRNDINTKKQKGNRCNKCEQRANAIKRLRLKMKELASKIIEYEFKLDKCKHRKAILKGEKVNKDVIYRPFLTPYKNKSQEDTADLQRRRKDKIHEREMRRNQRLQQALESGISINKHELHIESQKQRTIDVEDLVMIYFQPKSLDYFTDKLLQSISELLKIMIDFNTKQCLDDVFLIKIEKIQKSLKSQYYTKSQKLDKLNKERDGIIETGNGDPFLDTRIKLLKNTLSILNKSLLFTESIQMICLYDKGSNGFIAVSLPSICESLSFNMLKNELDEFKLFDNLSIKRILDYFHNNNNGAFKKYIIHIQIMDVLKFVYRKCIELTWTVNSEDLKVSFDENLFPTISRLPSEYYKNLANTTFIEQIKWIVGVNQFNIAKNLNTNMFLMFFSKILQLMRSYKYIMSRMKQVTKSQLRNQYKVKCTQLLFQLNQLLSVLVVNMIKLKQIKVDNKYKINIKSTSENSLKELIDKDLKLVDGKTCHQSVLSLLYYRHLQLQLIMVNSNMLSYIPNLLNKLIHAINTCKSKLSRDEILSDHAIQHFDVKNSNLKDLTLSDLTMGLISSFYQDDLSILSNSVDKISTFLEKLLEKIMNTSAITALETERKSGVNIQQKSLLSDNNMVKLEKYLRFKYFK